MRQRQIDFTSELGVFTPLHPLDMIPKRLPLRKEARSAWRQQYLGMHNAAAATIIMKLICSIVANAFTGTIGSRSNNRLPFRAFYDLNRKMIARHKRSLRLLLFPVNSFRNCQTNCGWLRPYLCRRSRCLSALFSFLPAGRIALP